MSTGIDLVRVDRLNSWEHFHERQLLKIFNRFELAAIKADNRWSSQRAAAYFALKEAFYKALSVALVKTGLLDHEVFFLQIAKFVSIEKNCWGIPEVIVNWSSLSVLVGFSCKWDVMCSYAHEREYVVASILLSEKSKLYKY